MRLPAHIDVATFDALHDDPAAWREVMVSLAREHSGVITFQEDGAAQQHRPAAGGFE